MHLESRRTLPSDLIEEIYPSYVSAWDHLQPHVAARHVLSFDEFTAEMVDRHITKIVIIDDATGTVLAMTTLVTDISAVPWANATFYREHYPDAIARGSFFYIGYTVVHRAVRGSRAVVMMRQEVDRIVQQAGGVIGFDMSGFVMTRGIGRQLHRLFPSARSVERVDTQTYCVADYRPVSRLPADPARLPAEFEVFAMADRPELMGEVVALLTARWPAFLLAGEPGHNVLVQPLLLSTPQFQVALVDSEGSLRGAGLSVPLRWDGTVEDLPAGWDDAIRRSAELADTGQAGNCLAALSITVAPELGGRGLGATMIKGLAGAARQAGIESLIAPVRPTRKSMYPLTSFEDYIGWRTPEGDVFDPWLRAHLDLNGEPLGIATDSMTITGTVAEWQGWLGQALPVSGEYAIDGGLVPLVVDRDADLGVYREPNVWIHHDCTPVDAAVPI